MIIVNHTIVLLIPRRMHIPGAEVPSRVGWDRVTASLIDSIQSRAVLDGARASLACGCGWKLYVLYGFHT